MKYLVLFAVVCAVVSGQTYETYDFELESIDSLGENKTFECVNDNGLLDGNFTTDFWILPDLTNVASSFEDERIVLSDDRKSITVIEVQQRDLGSYYCIGNTTDNEFYMQRIGLNLKGPYYEDLAEKYEQNILIAFASMLSFLGATAYVWIVVRFRYQSTDSNTVYPDMGSGFDLEMAKSELPGEKAVVANGAFGSDQWGAGDGGGDGADGGDGGKANEAYAVEDEDKTSHTEV